MVVATGGGLCGRIAGHGYQKQAKYGECYLKIAVKKPVIFTLQMSNFECSGLPRDSLNPASSFVLIQVDARILDAYCFYSKFINERLKMR